MAKIFTPEGVSQNKNKKRTSAAIKVFVKMIARGEQLLQQVNCVYNCHQQLSRCDRAVVDPVCTLDEFNL